MKADLRFSSQEIEAMRSCETAGTGRHRSESSSRSHWTRWVVLAALGLGTGVMGCTEQRPADAGMTPQEEAALTDTLATANQEFVARFGELDPAAYLQHVGDDIQYYFQGWHEGAAYEQALRDFMAGYRSYSMEITDSSVEVLGRDAGVATGIYRIQAVDTAGESQEYEAAFTKIYKRRNGSWKLVRGHESVVPEQEGTGPDTVSQKAQAND